jgi:mono/diheme cytochrome c family protein/rhodanese-related sulfurtransferase
MAPGGESVPRRVASSRAAAALLGLLLAAGCKGRGQQTGAKAAASASAARAPAMRAPVASAPAPAPAPTAFLTERAKRGAAAYTKYCALCHGKDARGYAADNAPSLRSETFLASASDQFFWRSIREGRPGTAMAGYARDLGGPIDDEEIGEIIAFLRSNGPPLAPLPGAQGAGVVADGEVVFKERCTRCHGAQDTRGTAVHLGNASFLASAGDEFLRYAIQKGRPETPMQPFEASLSPAQIDSVVAMLRSWATTPVRRQAPPPEAPEGPVVINPKGRTPAFTLRDDRFVPAEQVKKALEAKNRIVIIDARATPDWAMARIPGAISVPYYLFKKLDSIPKDEKTWVLAYCACPHHASGVVVDELRKRGYKKTAVIDEGILEWQRRKYPVEGSQAQVMPPATASPAVPAAPAAPAAPVRRP